MDVNDARGAQTQTQAVSYTLTQQSATTAPVDAGGGGGDEFIVTVK